MPANFYEIAPAKINLFLKLISKRANWIEKQQNNKTIPLKFLTYQNYLGENKNKTKEFESLSKYSNDLNFKLLKSEKDYIMSNKELLSNRNRWHKNLTKDIYISEGVNILKQLSLINSNSETIVSN